MSRTVGIAVGRGRLVAVTVERGVSGPVPDRVYRRELSAGPASDAWPELDRALAELRDRLRDQEPGDVRAHFALLPSLARTKCVPLPPAGRAELREVVARDAARHFISAPGDPVADAVPLDSDEGPVPAVAACAEKKVGTSLIEAAMAAGFETGLVAPGAYAAAEGATALERDLEDGRWTLEMRSDDWTRDLHLEDGHLRAVTSAVEGRVPDGHAADAGRTRRVEDRARGEPTLGRLGPCGLAAFGALVQPEDGMLLLPPPERRDWTRRLRTRAMSLAAVAVVLLSAAAVVHLWGIDREVQAVEDARAAISEEVAQATAAREAAERLRSLLATLRGVRPRPPRWPDVVAELARTLPASSYLEEMSVTDRGIVLSGSARSPSSIVARLEDSGLFERASLESVTRNESGERSDAFRILVHVRDGGPPRPTANGTQAAAVREVPAVSPPPRSSDDRGLTRSESEVAP